MVSIIFFSSLEQPEITAPPPTNTTGRFASLISCAALLRSSSMISPDIGRISSGFTGVYSAVSAVTFLVRSTRTGPGRPLLAMRNALRIVSARVFTSFTITLYFVIGIVTPAISTSWKESLPRREVPTLQVIATSGTESIFAVAMPVTRFVAPGPEVAKHTPTLPVALAYPSAAWQAPCSWDVRK